MNDKYSLPDVGGIDFGQLSNRYSKKQGKKEPDYIEYNPRGRDIGSRLFYNTGEAWLASFAVGGIWGIYSGFVNSPHPSFKIRINSIMNGVSSKGSTMSNSVGVIVFTHTLFVWVSDELKLDNLVGHEIVTPVFAGLATGALYKSTRGPRAAALASVIGAVGSCAYWYGRAYIDKALSGNSKGSRF